MPKPAAQKLPEPDQDAARLLETLHTLRVGVTIFDAHGRLLFANTHLNHIFRGLPPVARLAGMRYEDMIRLELPEIAPAALAAGSEAFVAARLAQLEPRAWEPCDVALADGRMIAIKARRDTRGHTILLWDDVTSQRHQHARLEQAVTLSADAFAFFDAQDRFLTGNAFYAQLAGVPLKALKGQRFETIITRVANSRTLALDETPQEWVKRRMRGHRAANSAGTLQTVHGTAYLVRDHATSDGGRAVIFTDITEKTRAETALALTQTALADTRDQARRQSGYLADLTRRLDSATAQADNAKTMLLRTMSHELKTPLNAILGFSDLIGSLSETLTPQQVREYAGLIHQGGANLLKMVNQIMDLTKISAGRYDLRKERLDAGGLLWLAREAFAARALARNIAINTDACLLGLMLDADEHVLTGMIAALLDNALTFTHRGGQVALAATRACATLAITIADNGPGVAASDLDRILQPFEHGGRAADHAKGAGLGLTLVKAFAELHGGALEVESACGKGFTARLLLPASP